MRKRMRERDRAETERARDTRERREVGERERDETEGERARESTSHLGARRESKRGRTRG